MKTVSQIGQTALLAGTLSQSASLVSVAISYVGEQLNRILFSGVRVSANDDPESFRFLTLFIARCLQNARPRWSHRVRIDASLTAHMPFSDRRVRVIMPRSKVAGYFTFHYDGTSMKRSNACVTVEVYLFDGPDSSPTEVIEEATEFVKTSDRSVAVYRNRENGEWEYVKRTTQCDISHYVYGSTVDVFATKVKTFLADLKNPHHKFDDQRSLNCVLHGEPGNGKTAFTWAIASSEHVAVYEMITNIAGFNDATFESLLNKVPDGNIVLIENLDGAIQAPTNLQNLAINAQAQWHMLQSQCAQSRLTWKGLAKSLTSNSRSRCVIFMTTNDLQTLKSNFGPDWRSPGGGDNRFTDVVEFPCVTRDQCIALATLRTKNVPSQGDNCTKINKKLQNFVDDYLVDASSKKTLADFTSRLKIFIASISDDT